MFSNAPQAHTPAQVPDTSASNVLSWIPLVLGDKGGWLSLVVGIGFGLRHVYNKFQTLHKQKEALREQLAEVKRLREEYNDLGNTTEQQSSTLYLMHREILARSEEQRRSHPVNSQRQKFPTDELEYSLQPSAEEEDERDALEAAQLKTLHIDGYISERGNELLTQQGPTCVSNSTKKMR